MRRLPLNPIEELIRNDICAKAVDEQCGHLRENYQLYLHDEADIDDFDYIHQLVFWGSGYYRVDELIPMIQELVKRGASVTKASKHGYTALHVTTSVKVARLLLSLGADINAESDIGVTPLDYAANTGNRRVARFLLKNGGKFSYYKNPEIYEL